MAGWTYRLIFDLNKAEKWLNISIERNPYPDTYRELAYTYTLQGKRNEAIKILPKLFALGREDSRAYEEAALIALFANQMDSAKKYLEKSAMLNENIENDPHTIAPFALAYFKLNTKDHNEVANDLIKLEDLYMNLMLKGNEDDDLRMNMAAIRSIQGSKGGTIIWLERAIDKHFLDLSLVDNMPWFKGINENPEYQKIIAPVKSRLTEMRRKADNLK